jgi:pyridoxine 4-dehydrogenase
LTGQIKSLDDIPDGDLRKAMPRFQPDAFPANMELVREVQKLASKKGCTPAQLAISWVKSQSRKNGNPEIIPIPGATTVDRVEENSKDVLLSDGDLGEINAILSNFEVIGDRYGGHGAVLMNG